MIAAVYARKSTEQAVADEAKSVRRQIENAREYALRKGWSVEDNWIFCDDGVSGAEFAARPGFVRLMASLKPRPPFQVLVMSEESRLGREAIETAYALKQLVTAGVRVFFYLEDRERTLDSPTDKILLSLTAFADELEREKARQRVTDAMTRKARAGHVTGGRVFGYDNVDVVDAGGRRSHVERRINDAEAAIVRRIFELAAAGCGQSRIAKQLNAEGAQPPRAQRGRPNAWAPSSVHEVLFRPLYRGEVVWNRTRKRNRWGEKRVADRPELEWLRRDAPELRIVPEDLWQAAHARIALSRAHYQLTTKGTRAGRPRDVDSKYLLPGLARCACCNGGLHVRSTHHGSPGRRRRAFFYACTSHFNRGPEVCQNALRVRMEAVDEAVLASIGDILTLDLVDDIIARVRELLKRPVGETLADRLRTDLAATEATLDNLTAAVAAGGDVPALVRRLQEAEQRRQELTRRLNELGDGPVVPRLDWRTVERQARQRLTDWRGLLTRQVQHGRKLLRELLVDPIRFTPFNEGGRRGYRFAGELAIGQLLGGVVEVMSLASPPGFEPGFQP
jgi:site-specific DNA recombinase